MNNTAVNDETCVQALDILRLGDLISDAHTKELVALAKSSVVVPYSIKNIKRMFSLMEHKGEVGFKNGVYFYRIRRCFLSKHQKNTLKNISVLS